MDNERVTLTRMELYELVWAEPMQSIARRFGISDVALAKACRRHRIPRPWRGYWQQLKAGKKIRRPNLEALEPGEEKKLGTITLGPRPNAPRRPEASGPIADQKRFESEEKNRIAVAEQLRRPHPLVKQTREYFRRIRRRDWFYDRDRLPPSLDLTVDSKSLTRALRIYDALIEALEKRGFSVTIRNESPERTVVSVHGEELTLRIRERLRRVEVAPDETRRRLFADRPEYENVPTGELRLEILDWEARGVRKSWGDGKRQRLEGLLNRFVVGLVAAAERKREVRLELEERHRRREEERQRQLELQRRREEEGRRGQELEELATAWRKARDIREFLEAVRERVKLRDGNSAEGGLEEWLAWAEGYADRLDPLNDSSDRLDDDTV